MSHELTYILDRKCVNCNTPIADQIHANRKFCPRIILPDGTKVNCKDRHNSRRTKPINAPFKCMAKWQKYFYYKIKAMVEKEGPKVTLEIINRYGINLFRPFQFKVTNSKFTFYYHQYAIEQIDNNTYKITNHELF